MCECMEFPHRGEKGGYYGNEGRLDQGDVSPNQEAVL